LISEDPTTASVRQESSTTAEGTDYQGDFVYEPPQRLRRIKRLQVVGPLLSPWSRPL